MTLQERFNSLLNKFKSLRNDPKVSRVLGVISIIYPLALLYFSRKEILNIDWSSFFEIFLLSVLIYNISMSLQNLSWSLIVDGSLANYWFNSNVYFKTILMKRLPGGVWHWLGRANLYDIQKGSESNSITRANLTEWMLLILSGLSGYAFTINRWVGISGLFLTIFVAFLLLRRDNRNWVCSLSLSIILVLMYSVCWLVGGLILHWLLVSINVPGQVSFHHSLGTWCLSSAIGMFFFFLPSGALIRDFTLSAFLSKNYEPAKFLLVILQVRIIFLAADFLWSFLSLRLINYIRDKHAFKAN